MSEEKKYKINFGHAVIDPYPIPPLLAITSCPIQWTLSQAINKRHAKHLAASIILGQPFNRNKKND